MHIALSFAAAVNTTNSLIARADRRNLSRFTPKTNNTIMEKDVLINSKVTPYHFKYTVMGRKVYIGHLHTNQDYAFAAIGKFAKAEQQNEDNTRDSVVLSYPFDSDSG